MLLQSTFHSPFGEWNVLSWNEWCLLDISPWQSTKTMSWKFFRSTCVNRCLNMLVLRILWNCLLQRLNTSQAAYVITHLTTSVYLKLVKHLLLINGRWDECTGRFKQCCIHKIIFQQSILLTITTVLNSDIKLQSHNLPFNHTQQCMCVHVYVDTRPRCKHMHALHMHVMWAVFVQLILVRRQQCASRPQHWSSRFNRPIQVGSQ